MAQATEMAENSGAPSEIASPPTEAANDNREAGNPTIVHLPTTLPEELIEPLARTLARVLVARALRQRGVTPSNDE